MSYRDDLYDPKNIIGYTGDPNNNPTVYFEIKHSKNNSTYGHITQYHDPDNMGREQVFNATYKIKNKTRLEFSGGIPKLKKRSVEYENGKNVHTSRNKFVKLTEENEHLRDTLALAIDRFPDIKTMYTTNLTKNQIDKLNHNSVKEKKMEDLEKFKTLPNKKIGAKKTVNLKKNAILAPKLDLLANKSDISDKAALRKSNSSDQTEISKKADEFLAREVSVSDKASLRKSNNTEINKKPKRSSSKTSRPKSRKSFG